MTTDHHDPATTADATEIMAEPMNLGWAAPTKLTLDTLKLGFEAMANAQPDLRIVVLPSTYRRLVTWYDGEALRAAAGPDFFAPFDLSPDERAKVRRRLVRLGRYLRRIHRSRSSLSSKHYAGSRANKHQPTVPTFTSDTRSAR